MRHSLSPHMREMPCLAYARENSPTENNTQADHLDMHTEDEEGEENDVFIGAILNESDDSKQEHQVLVKHHLMEVDNKIFELYGNKETNTINVHKFLSGLINTGLSMKDPRLKEMQTNLKQVEESRSPGEVSGHLNIDYETFLEMVSCNLDIIVKAFTASFVIPDFEGFCKHIKEIYMSCKNNRDGKLPSYIPQLARCDTNYWGVSICTIDGQKFSIGDVNVPFTLQSCGYAIAYGLAVGNMGTDEVHSHMGMEPSGRIFNEICLDQNNKPHNPMINSGAIMTAALLKIFQMYKRICGDEYLGFNNAVFLSERECADRNFALAYFMRENKCFPHETKVHETLDFYFQLCALEINADSGAMMAATLANGGINPLTGDPVLSVEAVRNTLTLMHSCGMYNYSGQFAFRVGLPAKSGVSGCILLVVPNTLGICLYSPPLDSNGNSCKGVQFCKELVDRFKFHHFDYLRGNFNTKLDPRMGKNESRVQILFDLLFSVAAGDISSVRRHVLAGTNLEEADYDGRTALHVAASDGHFELVSFLLEQCDVFPAPKDRWGRTPLEDARNFGHPMCGALLEKFCKKRNILINESV